MGSSAHALWETVMKGLDSMSRWRQMTPAPVVVIDILTKSNIGKERERWTYNPDPSLKQWTGVGRD